MSYTTKSYGRNDEVRAIFQKFEQSKNVSMPGPRRLGKTFVLDRLADAAEAYNWKVVKVDVAGCADVSDCCREINQKIEEKRSLMATVGSYLVQRSKQLFKGDKAAIGTTLAQNLLTHHHEPHFKSIIKALNKDKARWVVLIDELPIFLSRLHEKGTEGVAQAREFMNTFVHVCEGAPRVRWLITGSIGIEPLARAGSYQGVLAKFDTYSLEALTEDQACDYVQDLALESRLEKRREISRIEAKCLVAEVGWRSAFYIDKLANCLSGDQTFDESVAKEQVAAAVDELMKPAHSSDFGTWEEHLRKHYPDPSRGRAFKVLGILAKRDSGVRCEALLAELAESDLTRAQFKPFLVRLAQEGYIRCDDWDDEDGIIVFHNPLLRRWWARYEPQATA